MRSDWHSFHMATITLPGEQLDTTDPPRALGNLRSTAYQVPRYASPASTRRLSSSDGLEADPEEDGGLVLGHGARSEITSRWAMTALGRPSAMRPRTSRSCGLSALTSPLSVFRARGGQSILGRWPFHPRRPTVLPRRTGRCRTPGPSRGSRCHQSGHSSSSRTGRGATRTEGCVVVRVRQRPRLASTGGTNTHDSVYRQRQSA
jgi:hypothetical protein